MNVPRNELLERYREKVLLVQVAERDRGRGELVRSAVQYLNTVDPQQRFSDPIVAIFSTNISAKSSFDFPAAKNAFSIMEKYVINLLDCPWKREFRKITMYSGFYKTRIEPSLKDAWKLLWMIGYEKVGLCLELKLLPDASKLQDVAMEFYLASLECSIYKDIFQKVYSLGFTLKDVHKCRRRISGNSEAISKALLKVCSSEKRDEGESYDTRASSQIQGDLSKLPKRQQFEKHSGYEANVGSGIPVGSTLSESSQQQMGSVSPVAPQPDQAKGGNDCETRTESIEAMLRDITPEMIYSNANIRKQILTKLTVRPASARSSDDPVHVSLPPHQVQRETDLRPHTEPLLIPKQLKPLVASASDIQPYSEPLAIPKQPKTRVPSAPGKNTDPNLSKHKKTESRVLPNAEPLPVPRQRFPVDSDQRPWTEPLLIPKREKVPSKQSSRSNEAVSTHWQCMRCSFLNDAAISVDKCAVCGQSKKEV